MITDIVKQGVKPIEIASSGGGGGGGGEGGGGDRSDGGRIRWRGGTARRDQVREQLHDANIQQLVGEW